MIPGKTICSYLACLVVFGTMAGLELFNPLGRETVTYVWLSALGVSGVLLVVAWVMREHAQQRWLATAMWFFFVAISLLA